MADFVAVIRRTVDGLSDNGPEMRAKVYDKARGAVRRQLENMKPRPSDDMIERQMAKLEAAIGEVESDNAEALPPHEEPIAHAAPEQASVAPEPEAAYERAEDVSQPYVEVESSSYQEPASPVIEPEPDAPVADTPVIYPDAPPEQEALAEPEPVFEPPHRDEPDDARDLPADRDDDTASLLEEHYADVTARPEPPVDFDDRRDEPPAEPAPVVEPPLVHTEPEAYPVAEDAPYEAGPVDTHDAAPVHDGTLIEPSHARDEDVFGQEEAPFAPLPRANTDWELPEWNDPVPEPVPVTAHIEPVRHAAADEVVIVDDIPDLTDYQAAQETAPVTPVDNETADEAPRDPTHSWAWDDNDPFAQPGTAVHAPVEGSEPAIADWSWPVEKPAVDEPAQAKPAQSWDEIDDLLHGGQAVAAAGAARGDASSDEMAAPARPVSYRAEPKRSRVNGKAIGLAAVLLLLLGGGGYAYWNNQDQVNSWVSGMVASVSSSPAAVPTTPASDTSAPATPTTGTETTPASGTTATQTPPAGTEVAAVESGSTKFTQRLQVDGTELDQGPAPVSSGAPSAEEGKSVAAQTEASQPASTAAQAPATTPGGQTPAAAGQPTPSVPATQPVDPAASQIPAGAQKMFLYEERLGQSAPTAIEGSVAWSTKEEAPEEGMRPEPVIQAQINVPERGLTALMTIKRNADTSLPASHVIEFVFSLPETFEGGSIDSVQRVSMKRTEQDRGDALIAVPAKITEDFHMIALNDFPEAVTTNTDLLRSRGWIDIPLTYRNGRRALMTLEKGTAGNDIFNKALQAWSTAARPTPSVQ